MVWVIPLSLSLFASGSPKGVFVGVFLKGFGEVKREEVRGWLPKWHWVSREQVRRELQFQGWQPPLMTEQMVKLARALEASYAVDVLIAPVREWGRRYAHIIVRVVSAPFATIVFLSQKRVRVRDFKEATLQRAIEKAVPKLLDELPSSFPTAVLQVIESDGTLHLFAPEGRWKRGKKLLLMRRQGKGWIPLGIARIISALPLFGRPAMMLEAKMERRFLSPFPGDKAIPLYQLPRLFEQWTRKAQRKGAKSVSDRWGNLMADFFHVTLLFPLKVRAILSVMAPTASFYLYEGSDGTLARALTVKASELRIA